MQTEDLQDIEKLFDEIDGPDEPVSAPGMDDAVAEGEFTEPIEGEIVDNPARPSGVPIKWLIPIGLGALAIALVLVLIIMPLFAESATIIITPDVQSVTAKGDVALSALTLLHKTITLSERVKTTGMGHQVATQASGWVTFYNSLQAPQTVPAGTMLIGTDGSHVTTNTDAYIPAGTLATNGRVTVSAHIDITGAAGNIPAGDINGPCCRDYVFAYNSAFGGGQDARDYKTATDADIDVGIKELSTLAMTQIITEAKGKLTPDESMSPPQCGRTATSTPKPGIAATQVTVSVTSTCTVYAYSRSNVAAQEQALFTQAITSELGNGYVQQGPYTEGVDRSIFYKDTLIVSVVVTGRAVYHFTDDELRTMQQDVIGKSREQATAILLHLRGVHTAGVQIDNGKTTLPGSVQHITISVFEKE